MAGVLIIGLLLGAQLGAGGALWGLVIAVGVVAPAVQAFATVVKARKSSKTAYEYPRAPPPDGRRSFFSGRE